MVHLGVAVSADPARTKFLDKTGSTFELGICSPAEAQRLIEMYDFFVPPEESQRLPPKDDKARRVWVRELLEVGENFAVWNEAQIIGHAALMTDPARKDSEFVIFISLPYRSRGLGTALTKAAVERARSLTLEVIWLTVESYNFRAINLYKKFGFDFCGDSGWERMMMLRL